MNVEVVIKDTEDELFQFIKEKSGAAIELLCQWDLHMELLNYTEKKEEEFLELELTPMIEKLIKEKAPLHYQMMHMVPLSSVLNDCNNRRYHEFQFRDYASKEGHVCYWKEITYNDFEEAGFTRDFSKRVIEKLVGLNKIKYKRGSGRGNKYTIFNPEELKGLVEFQRRGVRFTQFGVSYDDDENWIYDLYDNDWMIARFNEIKKHYFDKIIAGLEFKDDIEIE